MTLTDTVILWTIAAANLLLGGYIFVMDPRHRANRYLSGMLLLGALYNFALGSMARDLFPKPQLWPFYVLVITLPVISPMMVLSTIALLQPIWLDSRWGRWMARLLHLLILLPPLLVLRDELGPGRLYFAPPASYAGGYVAPRAYLQQPLGWMLFLFSERWISLIALAIILVTLLSRRASPRVRRLAGGLLVTHLAVTALFLGGRSLLPIPSFWIASLGSAILALIYTLVALPGYLSNAFFERWIANIPVGRKMLLVNSVLSVAAILMGIGVMWSTETSRRILREKLDAEQTKLYRLSKIESSLRELQGLHLRFYDQWLTANPDVQNFDFLLVRYQVPMGNVLDLLDQDLEWLYGVEEDEPADVMEIAAIESRMQAYRQSLAGLIQSMRMVGRVGREGTARLQAMSDLVEANGLSTILETVHRVWHYQDAYLLNPTDDQAEVIQDEVDRLTTSIAALSADQLSDQDRAHLNTLLIEYRQQFQQFIELRADASAHLASLERDSEEALMALERLRSYEQAEFNELMRALNARQLTTRAIVLGILALSLIATYFFSWNIADQISRPVQVLAEVASRLGAGELDARTGMRRQDELGVVALRLDQMADQLQGLLSDLEIQVAERTRALERRATQIQAVSEVGRAVAAVRHLDRLLDRVVHLISEWFGFYHAGIFLMDEEGRWAELRAASSPGGQQMLARGHRLAAGDTSIVGWVAQHRQPRIALDVGEDAVWFDNPDLPQTRSEMALPLIAGGELLGVLDVQSTEAGAFSEEDVEVLQLLADQVAISIVNARLFVRMQEALQEVETLNRQLTGRAWEEFVRAAGLPPGYRYRATRLEPLRDGSEDPVLDQAAKRQRVVVVRQDGQAEMALPLVLRGQVIGTLGFRRQDGQSWDARTVEVAQAIVEEMVRALESARLFEEAQARAAREQVTARVVARIRESLDLDTVLRTAAQEMQRVLNLAEVEVRVGGDRTSGQAEDQPPAERGEGGTR